MKNKDKNWEYCIIGRLKTSSNRGSFTKWNKYKTLESAEKSFAEMHKGSDNQMFETKIVPYFIGYIYTGV